jgi:putative transposon-encoded protein
MDALCTGMTQEMEVKAMAYQVLDRDVKNMGNSGGIYLPKGWVGKKVKVLLLEV